MVAADLLSLELGKKQAAQATQRSRVAALAGQREVLQESMSERRQQIQVWPPTGKPVMPDAYHRIMAHMLQHNNSIITWQHISDAGGKQRLIREDFSIGLAGTTARLHFYQGTLRRTPCTTLQVYLSSLQAEQKLVRQVLADANMAAQQTHLRRSRLAEKHDVVASTVTPTATADQVSIVYTMQQYFAWQIA